MNMKRNKKTIGISCFVLLLLVGIIYGYMHPINIYRLEVTQVEGSGYGYKIYERGRLIIVQPFIPVVSGKRPFQSVQDAQCIGNLVLERIKAGNDLLYQRPIWITWELCINAILLAQSCHPIGTTVPTRWHCCANTMAQDKALSANYFFSPLGATT